MTNGTEDKRLGEVRHQLSDWLLAEGWKLSDVSGKAQSTAWAIRGTDPHKRVVVFGQDAKKPDVLVMQAPITVDDSSRARLGALGPEKNAELGWEVRFQLLNMGVQFTNLTVPLERFALVLRMYTDDLRRNEFFDRLDRLQNAIMASIWLIRRALSQPAPKDASTDELGIN